MRSAGDLESSGAHCRELGKEVSVASDKPVFKADSQAELARLHQENRTSPSNLVPDLGPAVAAALAAGETPHLPRWSQPRGRRAVCDR
jgi:hypothetical protein